MSSLVYTLHEWDIRDINNSGTTATINGAPAVLGSEIYSGDVVVYKAANGTQYYWDAAENRNSVFMNISGTGDVNQYFELSENGTVATLVVKPLLAGQNVNWITVLNRAIQSPDDRYYTITQADIDNMIANKVTATLAGKAVVTGTPIYSGAVLTLTASGAKFVAVGDVNNKYFAQWGRVDGGRVEGSSNSPYTTATLNLTSGFSPITGAGQIAKLMVTTSDGNGNTTDGSLYSLSKSDVDQMVTNGVTMTQNGKPANEVWTKIYKGASMVATADGQREFVDTKVYFGLGSFSSTSYYLNFVIGAGRQIATLTMPTTSPTSGRYYIELVTETQQHVPDVVGSNKVYAIDNAILANVNKERFYEVAENQFFDYGAYILSVLELPFIINPEMIIAAEPIQLADKKLTTSAPVIVDDVIVLDLGEITVASTFGDLRDYINTAAILHLPRIPPVSIDLEYVINQTIHIVYYIDVYTGQATVNIKSTKTNENIMTRQVNLGVQVPMANKQDNVAENTAVEVGGDNDVYKPFIEIVRNPAILPDGDFTIPIVDENQLNTATGFIKVDEMELKTKALNAEASEIVSKLTNGVIIK